MKGERSKGYLYSSLIPYATTISDRSTSTALAAAFMRSRARRSLGFSKVCLAENLLFRSFWSVSNRVKLAGEGKKREVNL